jgi:hypothetical protein
VYTARNGEAMPLTASPRFIIAITMVNQNKARKVHPRPKQGTSTSPWVLNLSKYIVYQNLDMFGTHGLGLVLCFGQEPAWLTLSWLTMVMDILKLQATVGSVVPPFLAVYT